jgi:hypothetical protein
MDLDEPSERRKTWDGIQMKCGPTLRGEEGCKHERHGPKPLQYERHTPTPVAFDRKRSLDDTRLHHCVSSLKELKQNLVTYSQKDTDTPSHVDKGGENTPKSDGADLGSVGSG